MLSIYRYNMYGSPARHQSTQTGLIESWEYDSMGLLSNKNINNEKRKRENNMYPNMLNRDEIFCRLGFEESEELLEMIRKAKNPNFQDDNGTSYLHRACQAHYVEAIIVLLERGANPNITDNGGNIPIFDALGRLNEKNNEILEIMLKNGLDLNKMVGKMTVRERIEMFDDDEMNRTLLSYAY